MINIKKFRHTAIIVQNLDNMKRFYTETLGLKCIRSMQISSEDFQRGIGVQGASGRGIVLQLPNTDVEIEMFEITPQRPASEEMSYTNTPGIRHLCFVVEDIQASYEKLIEQGIEFVERPVTVSEPKEVAGFSFAYFKDPEGNLIEINQLPG